MVSDAKKKKAASKQAGNKTASRSTAGTLPKAGTPSASTDQLAALDITTHGAEEASDRTVTGVLTSHPQSRDIHVESVTLLFHGHQLLEDSKLELNYGRCERPSEQDRFQGVGTRACGCRGKPGFRYGGWVLLTRSGLEKVRERIVLKLFIIRTRVDYARRMLTTWRKGVKISQRFNAGMSDRRSSTNFRVVHTLFKRVMLSTLLALSLAVRLMVRQSHAHRFVSCTAAAAIML